MDKKYLNSVDCLIVVNRYCGVYDMVGDGVQDLRW